MKRTNDEACHAEYFAGAGETGDVRGVVQQRADHDQRLASRLRP